MAAGPQALKTDQAVGSVVETRSLSPHFTRVVLDVPDLHALELPRCGDAAVGVYFGDTLSAPGRTYTVRRHDQDSGKVVVDVLMHGYGIGTDWVRHVADGDKVVLAHANSWHRPPAKAEWQLLVADMAGLPALARILEEPVGVPTAAIVEVADEAALGYLPSESSVPVTRATGPLVAEVTAGIRAGGYGYCWFAGEATQARAVRKYLRRELHWDLEQLDVMGYWRHHSADWDMRFADVGADLYSVYTAALADGRSEKDAMEAFDEALERAGL